MKEKHCPYKVQILKERDKSSIDDGNALLREARGVYGPSKRSIGFRPPISKRCQFLKNHYKTKFV